jgi:hypothetical protein
MARVEKPYGWADLGLSGVMVLGFLNKLIQPGRPIMRQVVPATATSDYTLSNPSVVYWRENGFDNQSTRRLAHSHRLSLASRLGSRISVVIT